MVVAETSVVTYTEPAPLPTASSVLTTFLFIPTAPIVSTKLVTQIGGLYPASSSSEDSSGTRSGSSDTGGGKVNDRDVSGSDGEKGLSTLEVVGIIIGIVVDLVTTVATVWMCLRGGRVRL